MSELEMERHRNAGLERARDSWYQEWYKAESKRSEALARIAELEAENERLKHPEGAVDICGTCAREWAGTCTFEAAKDRPAPYDQTCRYATSQWTRRGITR